MKKHQTKQLSYWHRYSLFEKLFHLLLIILTLGAGFLWVGYLTRKNSSEDFFSIQTDPALTKSSTIDLNIKIIREQLPYSISTQSLQKLLKTEPPVNIKIMPRTAIDKPINEGNFLPKTNTILFTMHPEPNEHQARGVLQNQMHVAMNCVRNKQSKKCGLPFFQPQQFDQLLLAIQTDDKIIDEFKRLYFKDPHNKKLKPYLAVLKNYQPIIYQQDLSRKNFETKVKNHFFEKSDLPNVQYLNYPAEWPGVVIFIHQVHDHHSAKILRYSYAQDDTLESKVTAFLMDDYLQRSMAQSKRDPEEQLAHRARHIAEFSLPIKRIFFKEWCRYFEIFHQDESYCADLQLKK